MRRTIGVTQSRQDLRGSLRKSPRDAMSRKSLNAARWQLYANIGTVVSSVVAPLVLLFGIHQFRETMTAQTESLSMQKKALQSDRTSKAAELFEKYLEISTRKPSKLNRDEVNSFRINRDGRSLLALNSVYSMTKGDKEWEEKIVLELRAFRPTAMRSQILCNDLTTDFREVVEVQLGGLAPVSVCMDWADKEW